MENALRTMEDVPLKGQQVRLEKVKSIECYFRCSFILITT